MKSAKILYISSIKEIQNHKQLSTPKTTFFVNLCPNVRVHCESKGKIIYSC